MDSSIRTVFSINVCSLIQSIFLLSPQTNWSGFCQRTGNNRQTWLCMINIRGHTGFNTDAVPPSAAHLLKTPSTPVMPIPSTMSRDSLKGTVSGVGRIFPCSKATPDWRRMRKKTNTAVVLIAARLKADAERYVPRSAHKVEKPYPSRCAPTRPSARRSGCSGCVCRPGRRCIPLWPPNTDDGSHWD